MVTKQLPFAFAFSIILCRRTLAVALTAAPAPVLQGAFNAGARFDARTRPSIPPPPPGVAPNMAQIAAMSGANVVASKKKNDKWGGGAGGGAVFW